MHTNKTFILAAAVLIFAACQSKEISITLDEVNEEQNVEAGIPAPDITAVQEVQNNTKSTLEVDGLGVGTIYWTPADEINVFYGTTSTHYVSQNAVNATTAVFSTSDIIGISEGASENIWGLYPYNSTATCTGSAVTTTLPAAQYGVPGTFDDDLYITLAHNNSTALTFYNVCGGIKFSLSRDDITSITFSGNNNEDIAGDISLAFSEDLPTVSVTSGVKEITLTPKVGSTFASGVNYYFVILPVTLSHGFTMRFTTASSGMGVFNYSASSVTIKRSVFGKKTSIDSYALFPTPNNQIWYTSTDGNIVEPYRSDVFGATLLTNVYSDGKGILTFDGDVTRIGNGAFAFCTRLSTVSMPNTVTSIEFDGFMGCSGLTSILIPDSVTSIGGYAFESCGSLTSVSIPDAVISIGEHAFDSCTSLTYVTIPNSVTTIGGCAFWKCSGLTSVTFGDSIISIGNTAFSQCSNLTSVSIPNSVTSIGGSAFQDCTSLTSVTIGGNAATIGNHAFYRCSNLTSLVIGNSIASFGNYVFYGCSSLTSVTIPNSVTSIGDYAFNKCTGLSSIALSESLTSIGDYMFSECGNLTSVSIPGSVTSIGERAFSDCSNLATITIPNSVTSIGDYAFLRCGELSNLFIPDSVTSIGNGAFSGCTGLTYVAFPSSMNTIGNYAFQGCIGLTSVTISDSVTSIGENAFLNCSSLSSVTIFRNNPPSVGTSSFPNCTLYVPAWSETKYKNALNWCLYEDNIQSITIPSTKLIYTSIDGKKVTPTYEGTSTFGATTKSNAYNNGQGVITFNGTVNKIGWGAYRTHDQISFILIPNSVTSIGSSAFYNCDNLSSITIPETVTSIGDNAFKDCDRLSSITILCETPPTIGENSDCFSTTVACPIYVPSGSLSTYKSTWAKYASRIQAIP